MLHDAVLLQHTFESAAVLCFPVCCCAMQDDIDEVNKIAHNLKARLDYLQKLNEQALKRKVSCTHHSSIHCENPSLYNVRAGHLAAVFAINGVFIPFLLPLLLLLHRVLLQWSVQCLFDQ